MTSVPALKRMLPLLLLVSLIGCGSPQEKAAAAAAQAAQAFDAGDYRSARTHIRDALAHRDDRAEYWTALGRIEIALQDYPRAHQAYTRALEIDRTNVEALQNLADLSLLFGQVDEAEDLADRMLDLDRADPRAMLAKGAIALQRGQNEEALAKANDVLEIAPGSEPALILRSKAMAVLGDRKRAAELLETAIRVRGLSPSFLSALLDIYKQTADPADLRRTYARLAELTPEDADLQVDYAQFLYASGNAAEGQEVLERAYRANPADAGLIRRIVALWLRPEMEPLPASDLRRLAGDATPAMKGALAHYALETGRPEEVANILGFSGSAEVTPRNAAAAALYADARQRLGRQREAMTLAERVLVTDVSNPRALLVRAAAAMELGNYEQALRDAQILVRDNRQMPEARSVLARAHAARGEHELASITYRRAQTDFPDSIALLEDYVGYFSARGDLQTALAVTEDFTKRNPNSRKGWELRAALCRRAGDKGCVSSAQQELSKFPVRA